MSLPTPTVVILDLDGTCVRHINAKLLGVLESIDDAISAIYKLFPFRRKGPPRLWAHKVMHRVRRKGVDEIVQPCDHIHAFLEKLQKRDIECALVSNGLGAGYGYEILKVFNMDKYFSATIFREDSPRAKPSPDVLIAALEKIGRQLTDKDVVWVIGDRSKDIKAAIALSEHVAGAKVVPIAYDWSAARAALSAGLPLDNVVMSFADMLRD